MKHNILFHTNFQSLVWSCYSLASFSIFVRFNKRNHFCCVYFLEGTIEMCYWSVCCAHLNCVRNYNVLYVERIIFSFFLFSFDFVFMFEFSGYIFRGKTIKIAAKQYVILIDHSSTVCVCVHCM